MLKPLYPSINNANRYIQESNGNKYLTLAPPDEKKHKLKIYGEIWGNFKDLNRSTNNNSNNYAEKYLKINFNADNDLPLKKKLELFDTKIVVRSVLNDSSKYYPQVFLEDCLHKLAG